MTREYLIQNLLNRYEHHGLTLEVVEGILEKIYGQFDIDTIHTTMKVILSSEYKELDYFSLNELICAFGSIDNVIKETGINKSVLTSISSDDPIFLSWTNNSVGYKIRNRVKAALFL